MIVSASRSQVVRVAFFLLIAVTIWTGFALGDNHGLCNDILDLANACHQSFVGTFSGVSLADVTAVPPPPSPYSPVNIAAQFPDIRRPNRIFPTNAW